MYKKNCDITVYHESCACNVSHGMSPVECLKHFF